MFIFVYFMSAWHDRVVDLTLFEASTGGTFDRQNGNIAGNLTKIFQKSQMPRGLPEGEGWAVLELTGTLMQYVIHTILAMNCTKPGSL